MSNYHIIIQQERRTQPERMAMPISTSKLVGEEYVIDKTQLHSFTGTSLYKTVGEGEDAAQVLDFSDPQFVMVAEWNLTDPYVICHKGDYTATTMRYAGWPERTKEQHDAAVKEIA